MRNARLIVTGLAMSVLMVGFVAGPVGAGQDAALKIAKHLDGPYDFHVSANIALGAKKSFYVRAKSIVGEKQNSTFEQVAPISADYKLKYFKNDTNITADVQGTGFEFKLVPRAKFFRVTVKVVSGPQPPACLQLRNQIEGGDSPSVFVDLNGPACP